jgi:hypothetical protein
VATATAPPNKIAMSRALGAAFLNHQVEQLEKSVGNGPTSGNWRDRERGLDSRQGHTPGVLYNTTTGAKPKPKKKHAAEANSEKKDKREKGGRLSGESRRSSEGTRKGEKQKDADVVVVDASVLVHALYQVKKWCRDGRDEVLIVPLEGALRCFCLQFKLRMTDLLALNTLDLLKKGTNHLAQRARAASRILEAQVGTNPRIRVQRDDAFVLWDKIPMKDIPPGANVESDKEHDKGALFAQTSHGCPEWIRRTICCVQWEVDNGSPKEPSDPPSAAPKTKVLLAVLSSTPAPTITAGHFHSPTGSPDSSPVPLPAPHPHVNKHEPRSAGTLVRHWAFRAGIETLEVNPAPPCASHGPGSDEEERDVRKRHPPGRGRRNSGSGGGRGDMAAGRGAGKPGCAKASGGGGGLVERPPAVMAMMEMVSQPQKVVRLLARGEKLDPDP